jgi:hypothetical protein
MWKPHKVQFIAKDSKSILKYSNMKSLGEIRFNAFPSSLQPMAPRIRQVQLFADDEPRAELAQGEQVWAQVQTIALTRRPIFELKLTDLYYALKSVVESWT